MHSGEDSDSLNIDLKGEGVEESTYYKCSNIAVGSTEQYIINIILA